MSMMQQPSPPNPPSTPPERSWLTHEWDHLVEMPSLTAWLLMLPTLLAGIINPLLPLVAYGIQRWAGASWTWRDRWASVWTWAKQGTWAVAILLLIAWLAQVHVLFFPALVAGLQNAWHTAHLPDDLSLSLTPMNRYALVTRILLFLPLAPALSLYYERIDSRTPMHLQRVLTTADLATPPPSLPVQPPASTTATTQDAASTPDQATTPTQTSVPPTATAQPTRPKTAPIKPQQKGKKTKVIEQMTIDSVLAPQQEASSASTPVPTIPSTPPQETRTKKGTRRRTTAHSVTQDIPTTPTTQDTPVTQETPPTQPGLIHVPDWDDIA